MSQSQDVTYRCTGCGYEEPREQGYPELRCPSCSQDMEAISCPGCGYVRSLQYNGRCEPCWWKLSRPERRRLSRK